LSNNQAGQQYGTKLKADLTAGGEERRTNLLMNLHVQAINADHTGTDFRDAQSFKSIERR
jgi:hypothetical protein